MVVVDTQSEGFAEVAGALGKAVVRDVATSGGSNFDTGDDLACSKQHPTCGAFGPAHNISCFVDAIGGVHIHAPGWSEHGCVAGCFAFVRVGGFVAFAEVCFDFGEADADAAVGEYATQQLGGHDCRGGGEIDHGFILGVMVEGKHAA